ncbi:D-alanyl-D-alanine carboxypeptidase/D-alanyl-D-alanine-endopeptidase [Arcanobacterium bovis]|uniref:D-alanyl-D-alanine carboxypeptidase/D-alanyl-D-alanine-endopeptidase n=1 Tax=Arcanobacterium bovis TaxID=2529275 RepID=A0A4Q9UZT9_9ACTO|nr:D-alanyl-D-alanine carboxypeptidase/D-alanyl-D-alanine-endopeptidase [Arcanobacterium bovis]TBW21482.1 D-alanyl-D-alanine carboxypeptidase/D-alanyl-D-alanine-endopeptidase [Arcanobacterium bovis]
MSKKRIVICGVVACLCAYIFADAWDLVPGMLTTKPLDNPPAPFPQVVATEQHPVETPALQPSGALPNAATISSIFAKLQSDPRVGGNVSGIVTDPTTGQVLGEYYGDRPSTPASTTKLLTATAALHELGPETTLATKVKLDGASLFLVGGGDIMLSAGQGNPAAEVGHAGLADLASKTAENLKSKNLTSVQLFLDTSLFSGPSYSPTWDSSITRYVMEMSPIAVNRNFDANNKVAPHPTNTVIQAFTQALGAQGISVTATGNKTSTSGAQEVAAVESAPVRDIVSRMLLESDNSIAETLGHLVAIKAGEPADFNGASRAVIKSLKAQGISISGVALSDSSGLSEMNKIPPRTLVDILNHVWSCSDCKLTAIGPGLPVAGLDGTLHDRFGATAGLGFVRAKTGSLSDVSSLAGYTFTAGGRPLSFAVIVDNAVRVPGLYAKPAIDEAIAALRK